MSERINAHVAQMWPELDPFDAPTSLPEMPVSALSPWVAEMVDAVATATGFDPSMGVGYALGALSAAASGRLEVRVSSSWTEQVCLYLAIVAEPGEGKSPVYRPLIGPLHELDHELAEAASSKVRAAQREREAIEKRLKKAVDDLAKAKSHEETAARADIAECEEKLKEPAPAVPLLVVDDITAETLGVRMQEQGERLAILSAEDSTFGHTGGRYHKAAPPVEIFLKSYGGEPLRVDRRDRVVTMQKPCLTICTAMQPSVLTGKGVELADGRGLLARFVFIRPPRRTGYRDVSRLPSELPPAVHAIYREKLRALALGFRDLKDRVVVGLTEAALSAFLAWRSTVEPRRKDGSDLGTIPGWAAKAEGLVLRLAALLWVGDRLDPEKRSTTGPAIDADQIGRAASLFSVMALHALDALGITLADAATRSARALAQWLDRNGLSTFTQRDVHRGPGKAKGFLVTESIRELERRGYVKRIASAGGVGRPTMRWETRLSSPIGNGIMTVASA